MPPGLPGGKRIVTGQLVTKKTATGIGNDDIREVPAYYHKILLKTGY